MAEAVETILAVPAEAALEPFETATDIDEGDAVGVSVQRARFPNYRPPESEAGELLVSIHVPYAQLPSSKPVVPDDPGIDGSKYELPPGTSPAHLDGEERVETSLEALGPEHEWFVDQLREVLDAFPVVDAADLSPTCIGLDGEVAIFGGDAEIVLDEVDPAEEVPEHLRTPGTVG